LILNKKSISSHEAQLFQAELEKYRPHQTRLLQANHKQASLMKELTTAYSDLLQDKRVRSEQSKYESITRQRNAVMIKYKKIYQAFTDLNAGLFKATRFYSEMRETVDSLEKNVETFVNNRRSEGAQLLSQIEKDKESKAGGQADRERERLKELMERMSMDPATSPSKLRSPTPRASTATTSSYPVSNTYHTTSAPISPNYPSATFTGQYNIPTSHSPATVQSQQGYQQYPTANGSYQQPQNPPRRESFNHGGSATRDAYNPSTYQRRDSYQTPVSPPPNQQYFSQSPGPYGYPPQGQQQQQQPYVPPGYVPPPPPPGPPPIGPQQSYPNPPVPGYPAGPAGYIQNPPARPQRNSQQQQGQPDPWASLSAWK
jgi:hypothetical protein